MPNNSPVISVIIPAYNASKYISETLKSILCQTYDKWEIIVVDDGSIDNTLEIVYGIANSDNRIKVISQANRGVASARNLGVKLARGFYISFLDADDLWEPTFLNELHNCIVNTNTDIAFCNTVFFYESINNITFEHKPKKFDSDRMLDLLYCDNCMTSISLLSKKSVYLDFGGQNESLRFSEDYDLFLRWAENKCSFSYMPKKLAYCRRHDANNTLNFKEAILQNYQVRIMHTAWKNASFKAKRYTYAGYYNQIGKLIRTAKSFTALKYHLLSFFLRPTSLSIFKQLCYSAINLIFPPLYQKFIEPIQAQNISKIGG